MRLLASVLLAAPSAAPALDWSGLQSVGAVTAAIRTERGVQLAGAGGATVTLTVLAPDLVRVRTLFPSQTAAADWSRAADGLLLIRLADDGHAHTLELR